MPFVPAAASLCWAPSQPATPWVDVLWGAVHDPVSRRVLGVVDLSSPWETVHPHSLELAITAARALERCLADARQHSDVRLRRRYADHATAATDVPVSPDGYVLAGERLAAPPKPLAIPEGGATSSWATAHSPLRSRLAMAKPTSFAVPARAPSALHQPRRLSARKDGRTSKPRVMRPGGGMRAIMESL